MSLSPAMSWLLIVAVIVAAGLVGSLLLGDAQRLFEYWRRERCAPARVEGRSRDELLAWLDEPSLSVEERARLRRQLQELDEVARRMERAFRGQSA